MNTHQLSNVIRTMLSDHSGTTFAGIQYETAIDLTQDARNNGFFATKLTNANVQLFCKVSDFQLYTTQVKKSASGIPENAQSTIDAFTPSKSFFYHTDIYSVVKHKLTDRPYLYCIVNNARSQYAINGNKCTLNDVLSLATKASAKRLIAHNSKLYNQENGLYHNVHIRTIDLRSLIYINANNMSLRVTG